MKNVACEEQVDGGTDDLVQRTLTDHLNTVRDIAKYDPGTDMTTVVNHLVYGAFGRVTSQSNPAVDSLFLFTARPFDRDIGLQNNLNRWYDASVGRWLSEDPLGFQADESNAYRYVSNWPIAQTDATGLQAPSGPGIGAAAPAPGAIQPVRTPTFSPQAFSHAYDVIKSICQNCDSLPCTKQECYDEAVTIARAFVRIFDSLRKGAWLLDCNYGWKCYQWQWILNRWLGPVVRSGRCFTIERVGLVRGTTLVHNWVAISAVSNAPAGCCTVYLDPWMGGAMGAYPSDPAGHPLHNYLVTSTGTYYYQSWLPFLSGEYIAVDGIVLPEAGAAPNPFDRSL